MQEDRAELPPARRGGKSQVLYLGMRSPPLKWIEPVGDSGLMHINNQKKWAKMSFSGRLELQGKA